ncbi:MAG: Ig-like domain-containing protein, partial [Elusimicrobia bacterium]|nr:Ig-like domain-containing protein [Elusimicrobiota bacterium]
YILIDAESNTCAIKCEFSQDGGATWATATKGTGSENITGLLSSPAPAGFAHIFVWNTKADLPNKKATVKLRITPSDVIGDGTAGTTNSFEVVNTASATQSTVICSPPTVPADGATKTTITITLKDLNGNAVADKSIEIKATGSNNIITQPTAKTDGRGETIGFLASTKAGQKTITATITEDTFDLTQQPTVTFTPLTVDPAVSTLTYTPTEIIADGVSKVTITATLLDRYSNPVSGKTISLSSTGSENTITQPAAATNANGQASGALSSTKMESKTITARDSTDNITLSTKIIIVFIPAKGLAVDSTTLIPGDPTKQNVSIFYFNPDQKMGTIKIFNLTGALILEKDLAPGNVATWDGKDSDGDMVETGIYIYQLDIDGSIKNGAIAVVK